jgi:protein-disulfide isomerase
MIRIPLRWLVLLGLVAAVMGAAPILHAQAPNSSAMHEKIVNFIRTHFSIPASTAITMTDLHDSTYPDFLETTVTVDDGKDKHSEPFFVAKNVRYLIEGNIFSIQAANQMEARDNAIRIIRERFSVPESGKITMADLHESIYEDFFATLIAVDDGKDRQARAFFVSKNLSYLVAGNIYNLGGGSHERALRLISLEDQPTQGPANAPATLVEYSDLACPHCALLQEELETEIIPKYGDKLRVVFKEFPLVTIHDWVLTGAIAAQCVYQIDSSRYVDFRSTVFKNQEAFTRQNARDMLLHFGAEAGVDNMKLAACIDARAPLARVEANMLEGNALGVTETPTSFVNGRMVVGAQPAIEFQKIIDEALHDSK